MKKKNSFFSTNGKYQAAKKRGRKKKKIAIILLVLLCILVAAVIVLIFAGVRAQNKFNDLSAVVQQNRQNTEAIAVRPLPSASEDETGPQEATVPQETEPQMLHQYAPLYAQNPDMFGWIRIDDTIIDYPVMHTPADPEKYLHTDFENAYSYGGVPFIDAKCTADSDNLIIYGHNMANGTMFREIIQYEKESYWKQHPTITFDTLYAEQEYEVLAAFYDRVYYKSEDVFKFYQFIDAEDEEDFDYAIQNYKEKALYDTGITASYGDQLITLVTCTYHVENGRFVVIARRAGVEK